MLYRETVDALEQGIAQSAQSAFRRDTLENEQRHRDATIDDQENEEERTERQQVFELIEAYPEILTWKRAAGPF